MEVQSKPATRGFVLRQPAVFKSKDVLGVEWVEMDSLTKLSASTADDVE